MTIMNKVSSIAAGFYVLLALVAPYSVGAATIDHVIHISVDGLRADAVTALGMANAPGFFRLRSEGAFTDNARTDANYTNTLPNHTTMLSGRGVTGPTGHNYTSNSFPSSGTTLHTVKGSYVGSVFDIAHDAGLSTGLYASKSKFVLFEQSYNATTGALDVTGADNGRDKIDGYVYNSDTDGLVAQYLTDMTASAFNYSFLHLRNPDSAGHGSGWNISPGSTYLDAVMTVDDLIGDVLDHVESNATLNGKTAIVLTADHGGILGSGTHSPPTDAENYTIPFYVWGPGVDPGTDLYTLNLFSRVNPGSTQPAYSDTGQPIRNGDSGNLALDLLGLAPISGSTINASQDLAVSAVPLPATLPLMLAGLLAVCRTGRRRQHAAPQNI